MAESSPKILEGVFAVNKPPHLSSAQVLRDLQSHFTPSSRFAPFMEHERQKRAPDRKRRRSNQEQVKIGHGGTLDPLATGVLIVAVGNGTKHLSSFLGCTKTYETVVLFGKSTDTYDIAGKVVASAPYSQITRELVAEKLAQFRGKISQVPPVYSALRINGMHAYEYARSGKELPRQLASRDMEVEECEMLEWYSGGEHDYRWPAEEASEEDKRAAAKLMGMVDEASSEIGEAISLKRKTPPTDEGQGTELDKPSLPKQQKTKAKRTPSPPPVSDSASHKLPPAEKALLHTHHLPAQSSSPSPAPAAKIRLTVSSGFYVRSFAHDLGIACSSLGIMASLVRSRQADFTSDGALAYTDLEGGEETWGPKVESMLDRWNDEHPPNQNDQKGYGDRDFRRGGADRLQGKGFGRGRGGGGGNKDGRWNRDRPADRDRRNTSSAEE